MIDLIITAKRKDLGGFEVGRVLPDGRLRTVGPFVFFDHMGPASFQPGFPQNVDVRPHPHIGLSTVTYLFEGEITHRDSVGVRQAIRPGEVNWMTAGRGVTHSERFERLRTEGGVMDGIQAWVALPVEKEEVEASFSHHGQAELPVYESDKGLWARLVAGEGFGAKAGVPVSSPMVYAHWELRAGAVAGVPAEYAERAIFVARGAVEADGVRVDAGSMALLGGRDTVKVEALTDSTVMVLGGEPLGERHLYWNFVSSSRERIEQAKADWKAGRFPPPIEDAEERIPLPEAPPKPQPNPMS